MSQKMVKWLSASLVAMGAFLWGCSESDPAPDKIISNDGSVFQKNDSKNMWARIDELGIAGYFDSLSQDQGAPIIGGSALVNGRCAAPALAMDENTRYLDELESLFDEGEMVEGVCGKGLKLQDGQVAPLGVNLIDSMKVGTVEFWFRPNEDFYDKARTLIGNDGARIHFFYKDGELYFQKNHHNLHYYVNGKAKLKDDWNLIAGQWGDGYMSVWVNGKLIAHVEHDKGYAPAQRGIPFENLVVIGYKSSCCMEGPGQYAAMTTSGSFDQFRISNITRYKMADDAVVEPDTLTSDTAVVDTLPKDSLVDDTLVNDTIVDDTIFVIGFKSDCCMEGPGQNEAMTTSGAYDQLRISNVARYNSEDQSSVLEPDTTIAMDTILTPVDTTAAIDPITSSNSHDSAYVDSIDYTDTERYPLVVYDSLGRAAIFGIPFEDSKN